MHDVIRTALTALDPTKDEDWTANGLPKVEMVSVLVGSDVTRAQIAAAAPGFSRATAAAADTEEAPPVAADPLAEVLDLRRQRNELVEYVARAQAEIGRHEKAIDNLEAEITARTPKYSDAEEYKRVVERAQEVRAAQAEHAAMFGVGSAPSQLDAVMGARRGFGMRRPSFPTGGVRR